MRGLMQKGREEQRGELHLGEELLLPGQQLPQEYAHRIGVSLGGVLLVAHDLFHTKALVMHLS